MTRRRTSARRDGFIGMLAALLSVLKTVQSYDLRSQDLREGAADQDSEASRPGKLARRAGGLDGETFAAEMPVDSDTVRRARAELDVVVGEIMKKPVSLEAALHEHAAESVSGTISVVFDTDPDGKLRGGRALKRLHAHVGGNFGSNAAKQTVTEVS
jgi:hypothetical protein